MSEIQRFGSWVLYSDHAKREQELLAEIEDLRIQLAEVTKRRDHLQKIMDDARMDTKGFSQETVEFFKKGQQ